MIKTKYDKNVEAYYLFDDETGRTIILFPEQLEALIDLYCKVNDRLLI